MPFSKPNRDGTLNGILFVILFTLSSSYLAELPFIANFGINSLIIAIILGIFYSNTLRHKFPVDWNPGIQFCAKKLLRLAIILYGFRITFQQIASIGLQGLIIDCAIVLFTLVGGTYIGIKVFKLDRHLAILISCGAAICGAAAVLAAETVLKSEPYKTTVAIGTVVLFGTIAMFLFPLLQHYHFFHFSHNQFGIFAGASIHEVAQAFIAGNSINADVANTAVIVKMTRVLLLVPALFLLMIYETRVSTGEKNIVKLTVPWFALGFLLMIGFNSLHLLPDTVITLLNKIDVFLLTMAMAAIGIETNFLNIKKVGVKPLYLATLLFFWLGGAAFVLVKAFI